MVSFTGEKDFATQPKRNRAATAINARTAGTATVDPSIHPNGDLDLKKAAAAKFPHGIFSPLYAFHIFDK